MTIASELENIKTNLKNSYLACDSKGATMPENQCFDNLPNCISSISGGGGGGSGILETLIEDVVAGNNPVSTSSLLQAEEDIADIIPLDISTTKTITQNGTYNAVDDNANGYSSVTVNVTPTLTTKSITQNGTYNASSDNADGYSSVTVNVSGGGGSFTGLNREVVNGVYKAPATSFTWGLPSGATDIGSYVMEHAFYNSTGLTGALDLSSLTTISGTNAMNEAFSTCLNLTSVDLSGLTTISGTNAMQSTFRFCTGLTSVDLSSLETVSSSNGMYSAFNGCNNLTGALDLSKLTTISGSQGLYSAFSSCSRLTSVDLSGLKSIGVNSSTTNHSQLSSCFRNCNSLTSITFPNLEKIYCTGGTTTSYGTFANNNKVQKMYFPKLDTITYGSGASSSNQNAVKNVFYGCSSLTELHFASANESSIKASSGYSTAWGRGTGNVTIYFDL